jgi:hypothetical protein
MPSPAQRWRRGSPAQCPSARSRPLHRAHGRALAALAAVTPAVRLVGRRIDGCKPRLACKARIRIARGMREACDRTRCGVKMSAVPPDHWVLARRCVMAALRGGSRILREKSQCRPARFPARVRAWPHAVRPEADPARENSFCRGSWSDLRCSARFDDVRRSTPSATPRAAAGPQQRIKAARGKRLASKIWMLALPSTATSHV